MSMKLNCQIGFTLAEVLITLGIIGVVAALTLPNLIADYRASVVETRLKKFYSVMNQAILHSVNENGEVENWSFFIEETPDDGGVYINKSDISDLSFQKYLAPYLKVIEKKELTDGDGQKRILYYFSDGSAFAYQATQNREVVFFPKSAEKCLKLPKNESFGVCAFCFQFYPISNNKDWKYLYNKGMEAYFYLWDGDEQTLYSNAYYGCKEGNGNYCTAIIYINGWKVPDNYPKRISF